MIDPPLSVLGPRSKVKEFFQRPPVRGPSVQGQLVFPAIMAAERRALVLAGRALLAIGNADPQAEAEVPGPRTPPGVPGPRTPPTPAGPAKQEEQSDAGDTAGSAASGFRGGRATNGRQRSRSRRSHDARRRLNGQWRRRLSSAMAYRLHRQVDSPVVLTDGTAAIDDLARVLREPPANIVWVADNSNGRFEHRGGRIRATRKHSIGIEESLVMAPLVDIWG